MNSGGKTPTTVLGRPSIRSVCPINRGSPPSLRQNRSLKDHHRRAVERRLLLGEAPAQDRAHSEQREEGPGHSVSLDQLRRSLAVRHRGSARGVDAAELHRRRLTLVLQQAGRRRPRKRLAPGAIVVPDHREPLRVAVGKLAEQHRLQHAEDGDGGADSHRQGQHQEGVESREATTCRQAVRRSTRVFFTKAPWASSPGRSK